MLKRLTLPIGTCLTLLVAASIMGLSAGSTAGGLFQEIQALFGWAASDDTRAMIVWQIRLPRVLLATLVGATLSLGGLVFQVLLRNPLAEPYILGISGGSAIGAIIGITLGLSRFPGTTLTAFAGSMGTLGVLLLISAGRTGLRQDALLLSGVMVNAFCSAVIAFLISMVHDTKLHNVIFWLLGDLSLVNLQQAGVLALMLIPCYGVLFYLSHAMNLMGMGRASALTLGVNVQRTSLILLVVTSFMVSTTVAHCGLLGFVGLVIPHALRMIFGPDHRILVPACMLGGGAYLVFCDLLARVLPSSGEMPAGVITAMIGAPLFVILLKRGRK